MSARTKPTLIPAYLPTCSEVLREVALFQKRGVSWSALEKQFGPHVRYTIDHLIALRLVLWQHTAAHTDLPYSKEFRVYASTERGPYYLPRKAE